MIEVAAAIIFFKNKILCFQRGLAKYDYVSYKYEFPGGKLNQNEDPITALRREIDQLTKDLKSLGLVSVSRTGAVAMTRGAEILK